MNTLLQTIQTNPWAAVVVVLLLVAGIILVLKHDRQNRLVAEALFEQWGFELDSEVTFFQKLPWQESAILDKPLSNIVESRALFSGSIQDRASLIFQFSRGHMHDRSDRRKNRWIACVDMAGDLPEFYLNTRLGLESELAPQSRTELVTLEHSPDFCTAYRLSGPCPDRVEALFDTKLIELIYAHPVADLEVVHGNLIVEFNNASFTQKNVSQVLQSTLALTQAFSARANSHVA